MKTEPSQYRDNRDAATGLRAAGVNQ